MEECRCCETNSCCCEEYSDVGAVEPCSGIILRDLGIDGCEEEEEENSCPEMGMHVHCPIVSDVVGLLVAGESEPDSLWTSGGARLRSANVRMMSNLQAKSEWNTPFQLFCALKHSQIGILDGIKVVHRR
jgi:hypothetical protein